MPANPIQPWIAVNNYLQDEYRETLADLALRNLPDASRDLRVFAKRELSKAITIDGFRSFDRAPVDVALRHVVRQMEWNPGVATAVICLWAEAEEKLINELQAAAEAKGLEFRPDWSWQEAKEGFYAFEDIASLTECTEALAQDKSSPEADHIWLATLWLSRALISRSSEIAIESPSSQLQETLTEEAETASPEEAQDDLRPSKFGEPLPVLSQSLQERIKEVDQACQVAISTARIVLAAIETSDLSGAETQLVTLQGTLTGWRNKQGNRSVVARLNSVKYHTSWKTRSNANRHNQFLGVSLLLSGRLAILCEIQANASAPRIVYFGRRLEPHSTGCPGLGCAVVAAGADSANAS